MTRSTAGFLILALATATACSRPAPPPPPPPPEPGQATEEISPSQGMLLQTTIIITSSGNKDLIGYRILLTPTGEANFVSGDGDGQSRLPDPLTDTIAADINAAKQVPAAPQSAPCVNPASLTPTFVAQGDYHSGDLACPASTAEKKLADDVVQIQHFLKIRNTPKAEGKELPPQNF